MDNEDANKFPAIAPDHDLYTIPSHSNWFSWDDIHEIEKLALKEFFNGRSVARTPKIYREYRDFIINKFREDPSRRITFTEIRKSLVGDVTLIHKVFGFLDKWGLINFGVGGVRGVDDEEEEEEEGNWKVVCEEGAPVGVRVVAFPNSSRPVTVPGGGREEVGGGDVGFRMPPLASYSDVFGDLMRMKRRKCAKCGEAGEFENNEANKDDIMTCSRCLKKGQNEEIMPIDDSNSEDSKDGTVNHSKDSKDDTFNHEANSWTDAEILLLLESILLHGDDWDLVAQSVRTKSKSDCIAKLIQLPFGELMLSTANGKGEGRNLKNATMDIKKDQPSSVEPLKPIKKEDLNEKKSNEFGPKGVGENEHPQKRRRLDPSTDSSDSLMKQVAHMSTMVSPHVAAAAVDAAITALCQENPFARMFIEAEGDNVANMYEAKRLDNVENSEVVQRHTVAETQEGVSEKNPTAVTLRIRTAIATAFGASAAHAKLLADQEDREIEHLVATVIETQMKKIHCKIKHFQELQLIMEKEYTQIQELKESILTDQIDVLQRMFSAGIARWKDQSSVKASIGNVI